MSRHQEGHEHRRDRLRASNTIAEILDTATSFEQTARDFYRDLAHEEAEHKAELEKLYYEIVHSGGV